MTDGVKWHLAFVFSTTVHEASRTWTALKLGDDAACRGGQIMPAPTPSQSGGLRSNGFYSGPGNH
jgi:hypothetical protein